MPSVNTLNSIREKSVLIVEPHPYHAETLPGHAKYFTDLGYNVDIVTTKENVLEQPLCRCSKIARIFGGTSNEIESFLQSDLITKYDFVFFNSITHKCDKYVPSMWNMHKMPKYGMMGIEHDVLSRACDKFPELQKLIKANRLFVLSEVDGVGRVNPYWLIISKYLKKLKKIVRFFFRIQDNKIKILKIPVWHIGVHKRVCILGISVPIPWAKSISAYWFRERANFGDLLNSNLFDYFGYPIIHESVSCCNVIAIGSLMEMLFSKEKHKRMRSSLIVYGTGFIKAPEENMFLTRKLDVRAVRGYNTLARLQGLRGVKIANNVAVADPGLLSVLLLDGKMPKKKYKLGIIPHYVDQGDPLLEKIKCENTTVIDITLDPISFINKIAECENVISSAMHGLIAADSLGIPNIRMMLSDKIYGGDYKFDDYYSAFGIKKHNRVDLRKESFTEKDLDNLKRTYQVKPELVHQKQVELLNAFPYKIKRKICL